MPRLLWTELRRQSERNVDVLAFAGLFLTEEHMDWIPGLRARRIDGAYFSTYTESFERVWASARPLDGQGAE